MSDQIIGFIGLSVVRTKRVILPILNDPKGFINKVDVKAMASPED